MTREEQGHRSVDNLLGALSFADVDSREIICKKQVPATIP